jgi:hypothetical protein
LSIRGTNNEGTDGRKEWNEGGMFEEVMHDGTSPAEKSARMAEVSGRE